MSQTENNAVANVIVFARTPIHGQVKKRLALSEGDDAALAAYRRLLDTTLQVSSEAVNHIKDGILWWCHLGPAPDEEILKGRPMRTVPQTGEGIAENLDAALDMWGEGVSGSKVLVLGADHPTMRSSHIEEMIELLDEKPVCIGPSLDGGFWCVGATVALGGIMTDVPLGTERALDGLRSSLQRRGHDFAEGPSLWDVDTAEDLQRWQALTGQKKM